MLSNISVNSQDCAKCFLIKYFAMNIFQLLSIIAGQRFWHMTARKGIYGNRYANKPLLTILINMLNAFSVYPAIPGDNYQFRLRS